MIQPLNEKILVRPFPPDAISEGGIIIPDSIQQRPSKALVIAVGEGLKDRPMRLQKGDTVFHVKNAGTPVEHNGEILYILRDVDCLGFIREEKIKPELNGATRTMEQY